MASARSRDASLRTDGFTAPPSAPLTRYKAGPAATVDELQVRRILCPIDFSDFSRRTAAQAVALARAFHAELHALFVFPVAREGGSAAGRLEAVDAAVRSVVADDLGDLFRPAQTAGVPLHVSLRAGDPAAEIMAAAQETPADLVVMGTHGRSGVKRWALGSVADRVLRQAPCPVVTCLPDDEPMGSGVERTARILCAVDLSDSSRGTLDYATLLASATASPLTVLHVVTPGGTGAPYGLAEAYRVEEARKRLREMMPEQARGPVEPLVLTGTPYREILRTGVELKAAFIVVGNRGRHAPGRTLFGSTADQVARGAECPVLTVPPFV
jgi:nucleotide-binding universal stress UspA family protein